MNPRERLRRAAEDGERIYRVYMHGDIEDMTAADLNRLSGILTLDLPDALGAYDSLEREIDKLNERVELRAEEDSIYRVYDAEVERRQQAETTLAHAEAFIEHMDMGYRWAEWCEGRNPSRKESYSERLAREGGMAASGKFREASNPAKEPS